MILKGGKDVEDKMFELMEKMYIEFSSFKTDITTEVKGIRQDLNGVKEDVKALKEDVNGLKEDVNGLKEDVNGLKEDVNGVKEDVKSLNVKVDKNTMLLENLTSKVEIIAEVQKSHMDQDQKAHSEIVKNLNEKIDVVELAVKDTSKDVKEIKNGLTNVEIITSSNWNEIAKLKAVR